MRKQQVKPSVVLLVVVMALFALAFAAAPAEAQTAGNGKYDTDGNGKIEISYLEQLRAMAIDDDGDGQIDSHANDFWRDYYTSAFPLDEGERICIRACDGYELTQSLDFNNPGHYRSGELNLDWVGGEGWNPDDGHKTTFEGNGNTISNLYINRPTTNNVGLFGSTATGSRISNVGLVAARVSGYDHVGALVGINQGLVPAATPPATWMGAIQSEG